MYSDEEQNVCYPYKSKVQTAMKQQLNVFIIFSSFVRNVMYLTFFENVYFSTHELTLILINEHSGIQTNTHFAM